MAPTLIPLILLFSFMLTVLYITRSVSMVKERRIKDYLSASGLSALSFWMAHFMMYVLKILIPVVVLSGVIQTLFPSSSFFLIFVFVLIYAINAIMFAFAISSLINKATVATVTAAVLWFALYLPAVYMKQNQKVHSETTRVVSCLLLNTATSYSVQLLSVMESQGIGMTMNSVWVSYDGISFGLCVMFMTLSALAFLVLCIIIELLPHLLLMGSKRVKIYEPELNFSALGKNKNEKHTFHTIKVRNISVVLSPGSGVTVAVKGISFDAHDKKSTVILGKNGSGKTSIISILAGMLQPAEGTATIGPFDVHRDRKLLKKIVGYCPQFNPLFDQLTVKEHILFYAKLKKFEAFSMAQMGKVLINLKIWSKRFTQTQYLSGGMRRKVSLAIALVGNPKVVLLDEPTSGLDPAIRKEVQHMLLQEKLQRLVLVTTHYLEEADTLGDQVIIMNKGKILDKGSSRMLKKKYGEYLTIFICFDDGDALKFSREVYAVVKCYYKTFFNVELNGRSMNIKLSTVNMTWEKLVKVMEELNRSKRILKISRMKVAITSLEDVYQQNIENAKQDQLEEAPDSNSDQEFMFKAKHRVSGFSKIFLQISALLHKKMLITVRQPFLLLLQVCLPIFSTALGIFVNRMNRRYNPDAPALNLSDLTPYKKSGVFIQLPQSNISDYKHDYLSRIENFFQDHQMDICTKTEPVSISNTLLAAAKNDGINKFMNSHYFSAGFNNSQLTMLFNNIAPHSASTSVNLASNVLIKSLMGSDSYEIKMENHPLPPELLIFFQFGEEFVLGLYNLCCLVTLWVIMSQVIFDEKMSGVTTLPYWIPVILFDLIFCCITCIAVQFVLWAGNVEFLADIESWPHILLLQLLHVWAVLPLSYIGSFVFDGAAEGIAKLIIVNFLMSVFPACVSAALMSLSFDKDQNHLKDIESSLSGNLSFVLPQFAFTKAVMSYYSNRLMLDQCNRLNMACNKLGSFSVTKNHLQLASPGIGFPLILLAVQGFILFLVLLCIEPAMKLIRQYKKNKVKAQSVFQPDVAASPSLEVLDLALKYISQRSLALNSLTMVLQKKDCVCLVGKNGAGKTSLFRALTGQIGLSNGSVYVHGHHLGSNFKKFDAIPEEMTVLENLRIFAKLHGISTRERKLIIDSLIRALALEDQAGKLVKNLSGGNKRKVSLSVAILGAPAVLLLDEPTAGIDPTGRNLISKLLTRLRKELETSILIASHSLDVIESTCTEVALLEGGKIKFRGSLQEFARNSSNFNLKITAANEDGAIFAQNKILEQISSASLQVEVANNILQDSSSLNECSFVLKSGEDVSWGSILHTVADIQATHKLHDFVLSEAFLSDYILKI